MDSYVIVADSACDIPTETLKSWGVVSCPLTFNFTDSDKEYANDEMPTADFYRKMREGGVARTSAVSMGRLEEVFEEFLKAGSDVLYIAFSSGLSTTCRSGEMAAAELSERYPDRTVVTVDSLAASAGYGLLLYLAVQEKKAGKSLTEVAEFVKNNRLRVCHWFTVETLTYLKRGGRVSAAAALVGNLLGIKPVLHVDDEGHLIPMRKVRGRKASIQAIVDKYKELASPEPSPVFLSHGDCPEDAKALADELKAACGVTVDLTVDIGPVIGAHSGPGTLALFFLTDSKR